MWLVIGFLVVGFVVLNVLLINLDQKLVGITGMALLSMIPVWYLGLSCLEMTHILDHGVSVNPPDSYEVALHSKM